MSPATVLKQPLRSASAASSPPRSEAVLSKSPHNPARAELSDIISRVSDTEQRIEANKARIDVLTKRGWDLVPNVRV
jgi:hypothetical protein